MKKLVIFVLALVAVIVMIRTGGDRILAFMGKRNQIQLATDRVEAVFGALQKTGTKPTAEFQEASCMWYAGKIFLSDRAQLDKAELGFIDWLQANGLYRKISGYAIENARLVESGAAVIVTGSVEGKPFRVRAVEAEPLKMIKK